MYATLLTFVYMLRYSEWNVVPIWFLYSSVLMVIRCADPVSVFFDTYRNILYQSDISGQDAQSASIPRMFFLSDGSVSQRKMASGRAAATFLWRPSTTSPPGPMPPSSGVPLHPSHKTSKASPTASTERCHLPLASLDHIHTHKKKPGIFIFQRHRTPISHI